MSEREALLHAIFDEVRQGFEENQRIMSFSQYVEAVLDHPQRHARSASQYVRDCFEHFGTRKVEQVAGPPTRWQLFDGEFDDQQERMIGHERAQARVLRLIENFTRAGRTDKLILLHGPNGSAKSTFVKMILRALEAYSRADEGAQYRFSWIFPSERLARGQSIGFGGARAAEEGPGAALETFAFLEEDQIDARLRGPLHDHPLLLIPPAQRERLLRQAMPEAVEGAEDARFVLSDYILRGDLSHTNRRIFDALLIAYRGDLARVLKHIQVERFYTSRRYRRGAVTVEPQLRVDAGLRQLTADRSLGALPPSLQNQALFEPVGDLVDANRGVIEYDDLFKRHPDLNKYLLSMSERGAVSIDDQILFLDLVMLGTCNEIYLDEFKQTPDYASFKGRVELVRLPYLLDYQAEQRIYDEHLQRVRLSKPVAPHTTHVAALWAVLTRLKAPKPDAHDEEIRAAVEALTPLQKADLYARGKAPESLSPEEIRALEQRVEALLEEGGATLDYEGRFGASAREIKIILLNAAQNDQYPCLSPLAVLAELEELVKDPTVFPFLRLKPDGAYRQPEAFIHDVRERYAEVLDAEVQEAMGLVDEQQYAALFARYIEHINRWLRGEQVYNAITGQPEPPDERFMKEIEETMGAEVGEGKDARRTFRQGLITTVAAYTIDHPGEAVDYKRVFPALFGALKRSFYTEREQVIVKIQENLLRFFEGEAAELSTQELEAVRLTLENLKARFGHDDASAREAVAFLLSRRSRAARGTKTAEHSA